MGGWVGGGWGGSGSAARRMTAAMFAPRHSQFLTRGLWLMIFFFFSGDESKQAPLPLLSPPQLPPPPARTPALPETITSATCWCCGTGRGIDAAGYCTVALFVFPFLEIVSEEAEEEMVDASQSSAGVPRSAVPYHPSEQIFDGDRGFVLHWGHPGNTLLMWSISLLPCLCSFPDGSPRHAVYVVLTRPEHPVVYCCAIQCACLDSFLWAPFNSIVSPVNREKINYRIIKANLLRKISSNVIKCFKKMLSVITIIILNKLSDISGWLASSLSN